MSNEGKLTKQFVTNQQDAVFTIKENLTWKIEKIVIQSQLTGRNKEVLIELYEDGYTLSKTAKTNKYYTSSYEFHDFDFITLSNKAKLVIKVHQESIDPNNILYPETRIYVIISFPVDVLSTVYDAEAKAIRLKADIDARAVRYDNSASGLNAINVQDAIDEIAQFSLLNYKGTWNASTGAYPSVAARGDYYIINVAGTIDNINYGVGDWIIYSGATWQRIVNPGSTSSLGLARLLVSETTPPSDKVLVSAGVFRASTGIETIDYLGGISSNFEPIVDKPRIDLLCVDDNAQLHIIKGAENLTPKAPEYPKNMLTIAEVYVHETNNVIITDADIRDVRDILGPSVPEVIDCGTF